MSLRSIATVLSLLSVPSLVACGDGTSNIEGALSPDGGDIVPVSQGDDDDVDDGASGDGEANQDGDAADDAVNEDAGMETGLRNDAGLTGADDQDAGLDEYDRDAGTGEDAGAAHEDGGPRDGGVEYAGPSDAGAEDGSVEDAGPSDAGAEDGSVEDAGPSDAGAVGGDTEDAGPENEDAGPGPGDAGPAAPTLRVSAPRVLWDQASAPACTEQTFGELRRGVMSSAVNGQVSQVGTISVCAPSSSFGTARYVLGPWGEADFFGTPVRTSWGSVISFFEEGVYQGSLGVSLLEGERGFLSIACNYGRGRVQRALGVSRDGEPATVTCPTSFEGSTADAWRVYGAFEIRVDGDDLYGVFHPADGADDVPVVMFPM